MPFINPIELLGLDPKVSDLDHSLVRKAKRKLFAEIELSDHGVHLYHGKQVSLSDCERAINELDNEVKTSFYQSILAIGLLNEFLAGGDLRFFQNNGLSDTNLIKQNSNLKDFVSPVFAEQFSFALLNAFKSRDPALFSKLISSTFWLNPADEPGAYKGLTHEIQERISRVNELKYEIENEESEYTEETIDGIIEEVEILFPIGLIDKLPQFFQTSVNQIASSINQLLLEIWKAFENAFVCQKLLEHFLKFPINSISRKTFEENHQKFKKWHSEKLEEEKYEPELKKWATILIWLKKMSADLDSSRISSSKAFYDVQTKVLLSELNGLPSFANEIRDQIALSFRNLSMTSWNKLNDFRIAIDFINLALTISLSQLIREKIQKDKNEMEGMIEANKGALICFFCNSNTPDPKAAIERSIYLETSRSYVPRRVNYSQSQVSIPRCKTCRKVHSGIRFVYFCLFLGISVIGILISLNTKLHDVYWSIGFVVGGFSIAQFYDYRMFRKLGIKSDSFSVLKTHPLLAEKIKKGWSFSEPTA